MWTPSSSLALFSGPEMSSIDTSIVYTPDVPTDPYAVGYTATWLGSNIPNNVSAVEVTGPLRLRVFGDNLLGLAPIEISYLENTVLGTTDRWSLLPPSAEDVIEYVPPVSLQANITLRVTATLSNGTQETQDYVVEVTVNYTTGRDLLVAAVDARR